MSDLCGSETNPDLQRRDADVANFYNVVNKNCGFVESCFVLWKWFCFSDKKIAWGLDLYFFIFLYFYKSLCPYERDRKP